jgi:spermidine/putrescine transport system ATP-binding protein
MSLDVFAIQKYFGQVTALAGVNLKVEKGEFFTLLGPSGCGKTTLLRIIAGLEKADKGMILLNNEPITSIPARERPVNTVFQSYALFSHLTVLENISFGLISRKVPKAVALEKSRAMLDLVQLQGLGNRKPSQMSGGQQQRVALARALVNEPEILLLDEPMSALDAKLRMEVQVELRQLQQRLEKTFLMVTHDQGEAITVSDRMAVMNKGNIAQIGSVQEVYSTPRSIFVADFLGMENFVEAEARGDYTAQTKYGILEVKQKMPIIPCQIAIRPENIYIAPEGTPNSVKATVATTIYRGTEQLLIMEDGLKIKTSVTTSIKQGDILNLQFPSESLVVLYEK